jgi:dTDP-4-amino-4,6-dideoxygalactose transaminase
MPPSMLLSTVAPASAPVRLQAPELPPTEAILEYYRRSEEAGFYSNGGPCSRLLAERVSERLRGAACVPVNNATSGLMAAMRAAFGEPDGARRIVLTTSFTFTATACAIMWCGFTPVFVDVEERGWHMDGARLAQALDALEGRVAGVLGCATFGTAPPKPQRAAWRESCAAYGVPLVIDSAAGFGAIDEFARPLGGVGDTEVFSFHATKPFAIGEGGLVATPDEDLAERITRAINFGLEPGTRVSAEAGFNGKLSELHAATALAMLDRFDEVLVARRGHASRLRRAIGAGVTYQRGANRSPWQFFQLLVASPEARAEALVLAAEAGVEVRTLHDPALHRHPAFADVRCADDLEVTDAVAARSLTLPMSNRLDDDAIARIAALVRRVAG